MRYSFVADHYVYLASVPVIVLAVAVLALACSRALGTGTAARLQRPIATALGAAHLAGLVTGVFAEPAACRASVPPPACFKPSLSEDQRLESRERWRRALERARSEET